MARNKHHLSKVPEKNLYTSRSTSSALLIFTPLHNQTVLCPVPPYGLSTMMPACCCRDLTGYARSGRGERAAAARGGQQNTGPFPARGALLWTAAPSGSWGTRAVQERRAHSPRPSSLCRSSWKWGNVLTVEVVHCVSFILLSEAMRDGTALQGHLCYWGWDHIVKSGRCQLIELNSSVSHQPARQRNCSCRDNAGQISSAN